MNIDVPVMADDETDYCTALGDIHAHTHTLTVYIVCLAVHTGVSWQVVRGALLPMAAVAATDAAQRIATLQLTLPLMAIQWSMVMVILQVCILASRRAFTAMFCTTSYRTSFSFFSFSFRS